RLLPHTLVLCVLWVSGAVAAPQATTTTTPVLTGGTNLYGVAQTFSSTVAPASSSSTLTPTGTISFVVDGLMKDPQPIDPSGRASISLNLSAGGHTVAAR